jgi:hypothetical protein
MKIAKGILERAEQLGRGYLVIGDDEEPEQKWGKRKDEVRVEERLSRFYFNTAIRVTAFLLIKSFTYSTFTLSPMSGGLESKKVL